MAVRSGDDRQVCLHLLQRLASARRAIIGIYFPPIPWPMTDTHTSLADAYGMSDASAYRVIEMFLDAVDYNESC